MKKRAFNALMKSANEALGHAKSTRMEEITSNRGFKFVKHPAYLPTDDYDILVSQSSAIGDYDDSWDTSGSSFL